MQHAVDSGSGCSWPKCQDYLRSSGVDCAGSWRCCKSEWHVRSCDTCGGCWHGGAGGLRPACFQPTLPDQRNSS